MDDNNFWYIHWPKAGIVAAIFILIMLFLNSKSPIGSFEWLYWLSLPLYMIHQFEEYVYPGGFKEEMNKILLGENSSGEILTYKKSFFINIVFIWILTPILIELGKISIVFPVILMTLVAFNGLIHVLGTIRFRRYNPGFIVSLIGNIPLGLYVLIGLWMTKTATSNELLTGILIGTISHILLFMFLGTTAIMYRRRRIDNI